MNLETLTSDERLILQTIALCWHGLTQGEITEFVRELEIRTPDGKPYNTSNFPVLRDDFLARGLIFNYKSFDCRGYQIADARSREELTRASIVDGNFERLASIINDLMPAPDNMFRYGSQYAPRVVREYRLALYRDDFEAIEKFENRPDVDSVLDRFKLVRIARYSLPFQSDALGNLSNDRIAAMFPALYFNVLEFDESTELFRQFVAVNGFGNLRSIRELTATESLFRADFAMIETAAETSGDAMNVAVSTLLAGDDATAARQFAVALDAWRSETKKRKGFPNDWRMTLYAVALSRTDQREFFAFSGAFVKFFERNHATDAVPQSVEVLEKYFSETDKRKREWKIEWPADIGERLALVIVAALVPDAPVPAELDEFEAQCARHGFKWPLAEIANLRNVRDLPRLSTTPADVPEFSLIGAKVARPDPWERKLNALIAATEEVVPVQKPKKSAENESRIVWLVDFENRDIQPLEQKLNRGVWSDGRNIALKRLFDSKVEKMSEADAAVVKTSIRKWQNYYGTQYTLDWEKGIVALAGHPLVFLAHDPEIHIHLVLTEPALTITEEKDGIEVRFDTDIGGAGVTIRRESTTVYHVVKADEKHARIAAALKNERLVVPREGRKKLIAATQKLASAMNVRSDLAEDLELLPPVEPDLRVRVLITPAGDWFRVAFMSKPFGTSAPFFKPGAGAVNITAEVDGTRKRTQRDPDEERDRANKLASQCPSLDGAETGEWEWELGGVGPMLATLADLEAPRARNEIVVEWTRGNPLKFRGRADLGNVKIDIRKPVKVHGRGWFDFSGFVKIDEKLVIPLRELAARMGTDGRGFVELDDGQFIALSDQLAKRLGEIATAVDSNDQIHVLQSSLFDEFDALADSFEADMAWRSHVARVRAAKDFVPQLPTTFDAELRPYQLDGFNWLSRLANLGFGACLADDMGLGKTLQALAMLVERAPLGPQLVVAPVSVCRNWLSEARRFAPTLNFSLFGDGDRASMIEELGAFDVVVTSYNLLQANDELFASRKFASIVLDEAQAIKNRQTRRSNAVMNLDGDFKLLTTGTPIENNLSELWNLFNFINPGLLGSYDYFYDRFSIPIERHKNETARRTLNKLITPFILRRRKNQVLDDLPPKTEIVLNVELAPAERAQYEALRRESLTRIESGIDRDQRFRILAELMKLRLASCHPRLAGGTASPESGGKLDVFGATVDELIAGKHRALVFSQFVKHLELVREYLDKRGIVYQYLDGSTPPAKRQEAIDRFQRGVGDLFLISLRAGGTGLNLTSADYVIHLDPWWNPAVEDQATDRVHRIGQTRPVTVYRIVAADTVEEKILKLHQSKRDLADSLLDETDTAAALSTYDLIELMRG